VLFPAYRQALFVVKARGPIAPAREHSCTRRLLKSCRASRLPFTTNSQNAVLTLPWTDFPSFVFLIASPLIHNHHQLPSQSLQTVSSASLVHARHTPSVHIIYTHILSQHEVIRRIRGRGPRWPYLDDLSSDTLRLYAANCDIHAMHILTSTCRLPAQHDRMPGHGGARRKRDLQLEQNGYP
jgi:hypothetical protein